MARSEPRTARWPLLIMLAMTLLLSVGMISAWQRIERVMASGLEFSPLGDVTTTSCLGPLLVGNAAAETGDMVFLNDVRVQARPTPQLYIVSGAKGVRILVTLEAAKVMKQTNPTTVDIKGTIHRLPSLGILRKEWKLNKDQIHFFGQQEIYVAAEYVKPQSQSVTMD